MNVGIVTTWFERGAAYVSRQFEEVIVKKHKVFIYARGGEEYAIGDPVWDKENVHWGKRYEPIFGTTCLINKNDFRSWLQKHNITTVIFNEQKWWEPIFWCKEWGVKTVAYIDYYTERTVPFFETYDVLICNTKKHFEAFKWHKGARYLPWGTNTYIYKPKEANETHEKLRFFHSCGMSPHRKGTDLLLKSLEYIKAKDFKLIIHSQVKLSKHYPELEKRMKGYIEEGKLEIIEKTVGAPGLYYKGDVYVYPSRLEGIGLTIAEAVASGLGVIVPDCGPMNEFVNETFGTKVPVEKFYCRADGYYWPLNEVSPESLATAMQSYIDKKSEIETIRQNARVYAIEELNWDKNAQGLLTILEEKNEVFAVIDKKLRKAIDVFEEKGTKRFNKYYLKFPIAFSFLKRMFAS